MSELHQFKAALKQEAQDILKYWLTLKDAENGGFYCYADFDGNVHQEHDKAVLLHSRILWTFSHAYRILGEPEYLDAATHCYNFIVDHAVDKINGGVFWMLDKNGNVTDSQKHVYNQGFAIYALSEYFLASSNNDALVQAKQLFTLIESNAYDPEFGGYLEAFDCEWKAIPNHLVCDTSEGVLAEKSMNTHLHILEAYTTLHQAWPDGEVQQQLHNLTELMIDVVVDKTRHFGLFFTRDWQCVSNDVSYGHDIEGTWLLDAAAGQLTNRELANQVFSLTTEMAQVTLTEGLERDGAVFNELRDGYLLDSERIWWVQAEAMVGFFNAYQKTPQEHLYKAAQDCWNIVLNQLKDKERGEWYWKVDRKGTPCLSKPKIEPWKCPYHNGRACLEVFQRIVPMENPSAELENQTYTKH